MKQIKAFLFLAVLIAIGSIQIDMLPVAIQNVVYILLAISSVIAFKKVLKFIMTL